MRTIDLIKEVAKTLADNMVAIKEKFSTVDEKMQPLEEFIKDFTPFDPSDLEKSIDEVKGEIPVEYDDSALRKEIEESLSVFADAITKSEYDDSSIMEMIEDVRKEIPTIPETKEYDDSKIVEDVDKLFSKFNNLPIPKEYDDSSIKKELKDTTVALLEGIKSVKESIPEVKEYDDTSLKETLEHFTKKFDTRLNHIEDNIPEVKEYDDTGLQKQLDAIKTLLKEEVAEIKKEIDAPLKVEVPEAKHYDTEPTAKGQFVIYKNGLYVNLLDDNSSKPAEGNASYKQIIAAPKELDHKGVYVPGEKYTHGDMVMKDNATWFKTTDPAQEIPSAGWKLMAKAVRGKKGETTLVENNYDDVIQELSDEIAILKGMINGVN